jgi:hypothetical protein
MATAKLVDVSLRVAGNLIGIGYWSDADNESLLDQVLAMNSSDTVKGQVMSH